MKILITTMRNDDDKKIVSTQFLSEETENIKHELIELEPLPEKEGYTQVVRYDKEKRQYELEYEEIPKTPEELIEERLRVVEKAAAEALQEKKDKIIEDELSELDGL